MNDMNERRRDFPTFDYDAFSDNALSDEVIVAPETCRLLEKQTQKTAVLTFIL